MEIHREFKIRFENVPLAEARNRAAGLREELLATTPDVSGEIVKDDAAKQDFGSTLVLVLGAPAIVAIAEGLPPAIKAVAEGIASYLARDRGTISIEVDGTVVAEGISGADAVRIAEVMSRKKEGDDEL